MVERDLVGCLLANRPFDQSDHAVEEALAGFRGDLDDNPVGKHSGTSRHAGPVATGLADDRGALAGDGALVDGGDACDHLAIGRDHLPGFHQHEVAAPQLGRGHDLALLRVQVVQPAGRRILARCAEAIGLGLATGFG